MFLLFFISIFWGCLTIKAFFTAQRFDTKNFGEKTNILNFSM
jgi:hypothetical protein